MKLQVYCLSPNLGSFKLLFLLFLLAFYSIFQNYVSVKIYIFYYIPQISILLFKCLFSLCFSDWRIFIVLGLPCSPQRDLPDPGVEPLSQVSPALAGGFFTTSITWKAHILSTGIFLCHLCSSVEPMHWHCILVIVFLSFKTSFVFFIFLLLRIFIYIFDSNMFMATYGNMMAALKSLPDSFLCYFGVSSFDYLFSFIMRPFVLHLDSDYFQLKS